MWQLTNGSCPPSPISDVTVRRTARRRVCLRSIPPLQYRRISPGADYQTQSFLLRVFGKRGCPNSPVRSTDEAIWHIAALGRAQLPKLAKADTAFPRRIHWSTD